MKDNSPNFHHFHLQPRYLVVTYFYEHYFLTLIPSLRIWGSAMAQLCLVSFCPCSGTSHLCRGGQLKAGFGKILQEKDYEIVVASCVSTSFLIWEGR